jgi:uncharacterized phosphosugar-binding protein
MASLADVFFVRSAGRFTEVRERNAAMLTKLGGGIGECIAVGGVFHPFGRGHSALVAREVIGRAGGLHDPIGGFVENLPGAIASNHELARRHHGRLNRPLA